MARLAGCSSCVVRHALVMLGASVGLMGVAGNEVNKYLMISAPRLSKVVYMKVGGEGVTHTLIDSGLRSPQGLAVDRMHNKLFVADPDARKIYSYNLLYNNGVLLTDGGQSIAAQNVEARWVGVDGSGAIFFSDERNNLIQKVSGERILRGDPTPVTLYSGAEVSEVSAPGGIAVDNFHVFWSNKVLGTQVGSVVKGFENAPTTNVGASVSAVASNAQKVYGVCKVNDNLYFTNQDQYVYGVKTTGGAIATITDHLVQPRGCAWDGDGTVYVADKGGNSVYEFAGNMATLSPARLTKIVDFEDAFGVAVASTSVRRVAFTLSTFVIAAALSTLW